MPCFACGEVEHTARGCKALPKCPICSDLGVESNHRLGSKSCNSPRKTGKNNIGMEKKEETGISKDPSIFLRQIIRENLPPTLNRITAAATYTISEKSGHAAMEITE